MLLGSNNRLSSRTRKHAIIIALWLVFTFAAFGLLLNKQLVDFDPKNRLATISQQVLVEELLSFIPQPHGQVSIVHFYQSNCKCQKVSERHIQQINGMVAGAVSIESIELSKATTVIPATPSVAIIENKQLVYFGPYGQGIACSETNGFAQTVLANLQKGYNANIVIDQAQGCYCHT